MGKIESVKERLQGLIDLSNEVTEGEHTDLTSAVTDLAEKAKKGGSANTSENDAGGLTYDIKVGEITEGGDSLEGFVKVQFYNDDGTTLLYTVYVPSGSSAIYAGETPVSTVDAGYIFAGFDPAPEKVTADMDCHAIFVESVGTLDQTSWETISRLSAAGNAENYFAVGDTKMIHIEGTVGTLAVNGDYGVYIIGFNHNSALEGNGIHFGTFVSSTGKKVCLVDSYYGTSNQRTGTKAFCWSHYGSTTAGGWAGCDMRYDILGSTDIAPSDYGAQAKDGRVGYDASASCASNPVPDTLMSALPVDLRAVMKPMKKFTDNTSIKGNTVRDVSASVDYLPLLAEFETFGKRTYAATEEQTKQNQYAYYINGNSKQRYSHSSESSTCNWWLRSPFVDDTYGSNQQSCMVPKSGASDFSQNQYIAGISPIFKV